MHTITLIMSILSAIYALPYGIWELKDGNKIGGITCIVIAALCVALAISNFWIE
ncbi:MAG: hypothetical protein IJ217_04340 [Clostridia bacterium]|nr:hypothetical protein [Clostridia bacterium]